MMGYIFGIICVFGLAIGQLLFKYSAAQLASGGSFLSPRFVVYFGFASFFYGITSILWVWILRRVELGRVYPIMALAFVLVPLGSHVIFHEGFTTNYYVGVAILLTGIIVISKS